MVLAILAALLASDAPPPAAPKVQARATIRILQGVAISAESWKQPGPGHRDRRERVRTDEMGRPYRLRTVDFE